MRRESGKPLFGTQCRINAPLKWLLKMVTRSYPLTAPIIFPSPEFPEWEIKYPSLFSSEQPEEGRQILFYFLGGGGGERDKKRKIRISGASQSFPSVANAARANCGLAPSSGLFNRKIYILTVLFTLGGEVAV